jgi:hypothetical protein
MGQKCNVAQHALARPTCLARPHSGTQPGTTVPAAWPGAAHAALDQPTMGTRPRAARARLGAIQVCGARAQPPPWHGQR